MIRFMVELSDEDKELLQNAMIFTRWKENILKNFDVKEILIHNFFKFGSRVGFIIVEAKALHENKPVPGIAFLRGDSVSIMPVFSVEGRTELYTAIVTEARIPIASNAHSGLPAGMIDGESFHSAAIRELEEEVGEEINISTHDLINLGKFPLSAGGCDEYMTLMAFEYKLPEKVFNILNGRQRGCAGEHENIHVSLIPLENIPEIKNVDARSVLSLFLYNKLKSKQ